MDALECLTTRRSIRKYQETPVEWDKLGNILNAAINAPSSGNLQGYKIVLVSDNSVKEKIAIACHRQLWMMNAPIFLVIVTEPEVYKKYYSGRGEMLYSIQDSALVGANIIHAAKAQGLGSCFISAFEENLVKKSLNLPDDVRPQVVIPIGYSDENPAPIKKKPLQILIFLNRWNSKIADISAVLKDYSVKWEKTMNEANERVKKNMDKLKEAANKVVEHHKKNKMLNK